MISVIASLGVPFLIVKSDERAGGIYARPSVTYIGFERSGRR